MREDITVREFLRRRDAALKPIALTAMDSKFAWMRARQAERETTDILRKQDARKMQLASGAIIG